MNQINLALPDSIYPKGLKIVLTIRTKRACKDIRIIGSKFTTNAKIFSQRPVFFEIKKVYFS